MSEQPFIPEEVTSIGLEKQITPDSQSSEVSDNGTTDRRVLAVLELNMLPVARKGKVGGWDNFEASRRLPEELRDPEDPDRQITPVIATTHHTDNDVPMTMLRFGRKMKTGVASFASNQEGKVYGRLMKSRLGKNIFNVANDTEGSKNQGLLKQDNIKDMAEAVRGGTSVILSSYSPHYENEDTGSEYGDRVLPETPGLGVVLTANLSDRVVLPVVVNWQGRGRFGMATDMVGQAKSYFQNRGRPRADLQIAQPIFLDRDVPEEFRTTKLDVEDALKILDSESRRTLSPEQITQARQVWDKLKKQAEMVMLAQAEVTQPESQGAWRDRLVEESIEHAPDTSDSNTQPVVLPNQS